MEDFNLYEENEQLDNRLRNLEAEQFLVAAMIVDESVVDNAMAMLTKDDFSSQQYAEIFDCIAYLKQVNKQIDVVSVYDELVKRGLGDSIDITFLSDLTVNLVSSKYAPTHAKIIKEKSALRKLRGISQDIIERCNRGADEVSDLVNAAQSDIFGLLKDNGSNDFTPIDEVMLTIYNKLETLQNTKGNLTGIDTGFVDLNRVTSGLQRSDLILLAARPAMGKTSFALNIAVNAANAGSKVALFSLEMSKEQYIQRILSMESLIENSKFRTGDLDDDDWMKLTNCMSKMNDMRIYVDDTASISMFDLAAKCRRQKLDEGLDLIVVDYLQLMTYGGRQESRQQEISNISRSLKALARELDCPVLALSQLSRAPEQRPDHRPLLSDLRESGAIEQDADIVMMMYRDDYYTKEESEKKGITEIILAKHRNGPIGTVELVFVDRLTKFTDKPFGYDDGGGFEM